MFARLLVAVVVSFAGLLALAIGFRKPIAEELLIAELQRLTGESVAVSVTRLDRDHLALRGLQIGDVLQIPRLDARYSPTGLFASRLDAISVSGLRLKGSLGAAGISFGRLDAMLDSPTSGEPTRAISLPTTRLELDDCRIELATPEGPLIVSMDSRISQKSFGQLEATAELGLEHRLATLKAVLTASGENEDWTGDLSLDAALSGDFGPSLHIGDFTLSAHPTFAIERGQVTIRTEACAELRIDQLEMTNGPRLTRPLEMCIRSETVSIGPDGESVIDLVTSIEPFSVDLGGGLEVFGEIPELNLLGHRSSGGELSGSLSIDGGYLELPQRIGARGIRLEASISAESESSESETKIELQIDSLFDSQKPARFTDLNLHANLVRAGSGIGASIESPIQFDIELADAERNVVLTIAGEHELALGAGHASVQLQPFVFCPGGSELTSVLPMLQGISSNAQGLIEAKGRLDWDSEGVSGQLDVALRGVSATTPLLAFENLNMAVSLRESGTPPGQLLSIGRISFGLELTGGEVLFQILPTGEISIESALWEFAGGELSTAGQIDPSSEQQALVFDIRGLDLAALLELAALDGLSGTGTLEGRLPLDRNGDRIDIRDAQLHSGGGTIRYQPEAGAAGLGKANQQFGLLLRVLEDFHYTHLSLTINGDAAGEVAIAIRLEGSNPGYEGGRAVHFNLSIDSRLSDLISKENVIYQIPHLIEERFRAFSGSEVNLSPPPCVHPSESVDGGATQR